MKGVPQDTGKFPVHGVNRRVVFARVVHLHKHNPARPYQPMSRPSEINSRNGKIGGSIITKTHDVLQFLNVECCIAFARSIGKVGLHNPCRGCNNRGCRQVDGRSEFHHNPGATMSNNATTVSVEIEFKRESNRQ